MKCGKCGRGRVRRGRDICKKREGEKKELRNESM